MTQLDNCIEIPGSMLLLITSKFKYLMRVIVLCVLKAHLSKYNYRSGIRCLAV